MKRTLLAIALLASTGLAWGAEGDCELDDLMHAQRVQMDQRVQDIYKLPESTMDNAPHVKDASCLPLFDDLDKLIRLRIPTLGGFGDIWTKIKDQACKVANNYLQQIANRAKTSVSDPLGVVTVSAGTTTGEGGVNVETYDFGKVLEQAGTGVLNQGGSVIKGGINGAINDLPVGPANRTPRVETEIKNGAIDAIFSR